MIVVQKRCESEMWKGAVHSVYLFKSNFLFSTAVDIDLCLAESQ